MEDTDAQASSPEKVEAIIYTRDWCGYCSAAKKLLEQLKVPYQEFDVGHDATLLDEMLEKSEGRTSVPQIFINGKGIGGYTDLHQMVQSQSSS